MTRRYVPARPFLDVGAYRVGPANLRVTPPGAPARSRRRGRQFGRIDRVLIASLSREDDQVSDYRIVYGDDEQVVRETYRDVEVVREDGWVVLLRADDAVLRAREEHVQSLEVVPSEDA